MANTSITPNTGNLLTQQGVRVVTGLAGALLLLGAGAMLPSVQITPGTGSLAFAGQSLNNDTGITPARASLVLSGQTSRLDGRIAGGIGGLSLVGQAASVVIAGPIITPNAGALALTPTAPTYDIANTSPAGSLVFAGQSSTVTVSQPTIQTVTGALGFTGSQPTVLVSGNLPQITPNTGRLRLAQASPELTPGAATLTLTGTIPSFVPVVDTPITPNTGAAFFGDFSGMAPDAGSLALVGQMAGVGRSVLPLTAALALTGQGPIVDVAGTRLVPGTGILSATGVAASTIAGTVAIPSVGSIAFTPISPVQGFVVTGQPGALVITGGGTQVALVVITPAAGTLTLTGGTASSPGLSFTTTPGAGSLTLNGQVVVPSQGFILQPVTRRPIPAYIRRLRVLGVR